MNTSALGSLGWSETELCGVDLGDRRLNRRLIRTMGHLAKSPSVSLPRALPRWADLKGCYRLLSSERVTPMKIRLPHQASTVARCRGHQTIIVAQDITSIDFTTRKSVEGLGYLDQPFLRGILLQTALAISLDGTPLGILEQQSWIRPFEGLVKRTKTQKSRNNRARPIAEKQTQRWLDVQASVYQQLSQTTTSLIVVADREADFYEFFALPRPPSMEVVVRSTHNRKLAIEPTSSHRTMQDALAAAPVLGTHTIEVARRPNRPARTAQLEIRVVELNLARPVRFSVDSTAPATVSIRVVQAVEIDPPVDVPAIKWVLLTSLAVTSLEMATDVLEYYSRRWLVERFHYTLKSGCAIEDLQLESRQSLDNAIAMLSIIAWRLMYLLYEARSDPDRTAAEEFNAKQMAVLLMVATRQQPTKEYRTNRARTRSPVLQLSLHEAMIVIARMGGFLARAGDGEPGIKTLWRGLKELNIMVQALDWMQLPTNVVGNG